MTDVFVLYRNRVREGMPAINSPVCASLSLFAAELGFDIDRADAMTRMSLSSIRFTSHTHKHKHMFISDRRGIFLLSGFNEMVIGMLTLIYTEVPFLTSSK